MQKFVASRVLTGLLDSLTLMMYPVIAGQGRHLFEPGDPTTRLSLQNSRVTSAGNTILSYAPLRLGL